ncbi:MAG: hypothetical protein CMJ23_01510 [Phycisphaerae bacterium]|nr:hypothetical protein [Phycisphaerae bacterium]
MKQSVPAGSAESGRLNHRINLLREHRFRAGMPFLLLALAAFLGACNPGGSVVEGDWTRGKPPVPGSKENWDLINRAQSERLEALSVFSSAGTVTLRWTDDDGSHVEQADHRIWRSSADRAAIRLSKVGSSLLLAGWNGDRWWVFDETGEESVLRIRRLNAEEGLGGPGGLLSPPALLAMIGFLPWPAEPPVDFQTAGARARFTVDPIRWEVGDRVLELPGSLVVELLDPYYGPTRLQLLDAEGGLVATATHEGLISVETMGRPPGAWPDLPRRVRIVRSPEDQVVISFDGPLAQGRVSERLFDVESLIERSRPDVIERSAGVEDEE